MVVISVKLIVLVLTMALFSPLILCQTLQEKKIRIDKLIGNLTVEKADCSKLTINHPGMDITNNDTIIVGENSRVLLKIDDVGKTVLFAGSKTKFITPQSIFLLSGRVGIKIAGNLKLKKKTGFSVRTTKAIIGVKGTEFLVFSDPQAIDVYLKKGRLKVEALENQFFKFTKKAEAEFDDLVKSKELEFEQEVQAKELAFDELVKQKEMEFQYLVDHFYIENAQAFSIDGNQPQAINFSDEALKAFHELENW